MAGRACNDCLGVLEFDWFGGISAYWFKPFQPYSDYYGCYLYKATKNF